MKYYTWSVNDLIEAGEWFVNYKKCRHEAFEQYRRMGLKISVKIYDNFGNVYEYINHKNYIKKNIHYLLDI